MNLMTDDLTGEEGPEVAQHTITIDGLVYEVQLGPDSYDQMLDAMQPFVRVATKRGKARKR